MLASRRAISQGSSHGPNPLTLVNLGTPGKSTTSTFTLVFPATAAGSILVAAIGDANDATVAPAGWTIDVSSLLATGIYILRRTATSVGQTTQAFTVSGAGCLGVTWEIGGGATGLDPGKTASNGSVPVQSHLQTAPALTPSAANSFAVWAMLLGGSDGTGGTIDSGFTADVTLDTVITGGVANHNFLVGHQILSTAATMQPTGNWTQLHAVDAAMAVYR